jgi:hypothetical protein
MKSENRSQEFYSPKECFSSYNLFTMKKSAPLAFRIPDDLKKGLEQIAHREARSVSQICQILLTIGTEAYNKEGSKYLQTYLGNSKKG